MVVGSTLDPSLIPRPVVGSTLDPSLIPRPLQEWGYLVPPLCYKSISVQQYIQYEGKGLTYASLRFLTTWDQRYVVQSADVAMWLACLQVLWKQNFWHCVFYGVRICTGFSSSNELNHYGEHQEHMVISPVIAALQMMSSCALVKTDDGGKLTVETDGGNWRLLIQLFLKQCLSFG